MTDRRDRIAAVLRERVACDYHDTYETVADAVIAALGRRRCQRCRKDHPLDQFPPPHEGSDVMRPFCVSCTDYIEWATS